MEGETDEGSRVRAGGSGWGSVGGAALMSARRFPITPVAGWEKRLPWLRAGTTRRPGGTGDSPPPAGADSPAVKRSRAGGSSGGSVDPGIPPLPDMLELTAGHAWRSVVRSRQVHGSRTMVHVNVAAGECVAGDADGHATRSPGVLLTVTVADCVPVFAVDPVRRAVGLFHAGWRGVAAGVVESGIGAMATSFGSAPADLRVHLGPAICGDCYEVGPEVFRALGESPPATPMPIDLRRIIGQRAIAAGVRGGRVSVSDECTLCGDGRYFSHRRGDTGRQRAFIGIVG